MVQRTDDSASRGDDAQDLSALMDGALRGSSADAACALWRNSARAREDWHAWHLIGDVLRSDDLATTPARDAAFLQALRGRLASEPVPLAPAALTVHPEPEPAAEQPLQVANGVPVAGFVAPAGRGGRRGRYRLVAPMAMAAGFVAVVGAMLVINSPSGTPAGGQIAGAPQTAPAGPVMAGGSGGGVVPVVVRDPVLDAYLSAHRSQALGAPPAGSGLHRVITVNERP